MGTKRTVPITLTRRAVLSAIGASVITPFHVSATQKKYLYGACAAAGNQFFFVVCTQELERIWRVSLPSRGHGVACNGRFIAVIARRPANWVTVLDLHSRRIVKTFHTTVTRHLMGHGVFLPSGLLALTENDFDGERGVIGLYHPLEDWRRVGEWSSHGVGPHELVVLPKKRLIVVANGGHVTHPDFPRRVLNRADVSSGLVTLDAYTGERIHFHTPDDLKGRVSIRHLAVTQSEAVIWGAQAEPGQSNNLELVGSYIPGENISAWQASHMGALKGYVGSVATSGDYAITTSPRGNCALIWHIPTHTLDQTLHGQDICGAAPKKDTTFVTTSGSNPAWRWDNHLTKL